MATLTISQPISSFRLTITNGNHVDGIGPVTIQESLGYFTRFLDWLFCRKRVWEEFETNLGTLHIDTQDEQLSYLLSRVSLTSGKAIRSTARPAGPVLSSSTVNARLQQECETYTTAKARGNQTAADNSLNTIRTLMMQSADPFRMDLTAFHMAGNDLELIKVLTRTENVKAFENCKNIHDFWAIIYPSSTKELPEGREEWIQLLLQDSLPLTEQFKQMISPEAVSTLPTFKEVVLELEEQNKDKKLTLQGILDHLRKRCLPFDAAWKKFGFNTPNIVEVPSTFFGGEGLRVHYRGGGAVYDEVTHTISIEETGSIQQKIFGLGFEIMNALQQTRFVELTQLMKSRETRLPREGYAFLKEYIEHESRQGLEMTSPKGTIKKMDLRTNWLLQNFTSDSRLISHTDYYRRDWDERHAWSWACSHRADFQARITELSQV